MNGIPSFDIRTVALQRQAAHSRLWRSRIQGIKAEAALLAYRLAVDSLSIAEEGKCYCDRGAGFVAIQCSIVIAILCITGQYKS